MSNARNLSNLLGSGTTIATASIADDAITTPKIDDSAFKAHKNIVINGNFAVAQRGTSSTNNGYGSVDRWQNSYSSGTSTGSQESLTSSDTPYGLGFRNFFRLTNTATASGTGDYRQIVQQIEAQNIANSGWNYTSTSSFVTLSYWVRTSVAGKYGIVLVTNDSPAYQFAFTETLSANTWTKVTKTISGNSNLVFNNDNGLGLTLAIEAWMGSDYTDSSATLDSWVAFDSSVYLPTDIVNWAGTSSATFDVTGVQFEVGETATPFEHEDYSTTVRRCQRYYETGATGASGGLSFGSGYTGGFVNFKESKRISPVLDKANVTATNVYGGTINLGFAGGTACKDPNGFAHSCINGAAATAYVMTYTANAEF